MVQLAWKKSGFPPERVIGMAGRARLRALPHVHRPELNVSVENVTAFVLGGHGDTMVPLPRYSTVAGIPITDLLPKEQIDALVTRTANGGAEIVELPEVRQRLLRAGASAVEMVEAILKDKKKILPCAAYLDGQYGDEGPLRRRAGEARPRRRRADHRDQAHARRAGRVRQVGRRRARAGGQAQALAGDESWPRRKRRSGRPPARRPRLGPRRRRPRRRRSRRSRRATTRSRRTSR